MRRACLFGFQLKNQHHPPSAEAAEVEGPRHGRLGLAGAAGEMFEEIPSPGISESLGGGHCK